MPRTLTCAIAQMNARLGATAANLTEVCRLSALAAGRGARLIILPEGCLTGNAFGDAARQATLPLEPRAFAPLADAARQHGITICAGFATPFGRSFNIVQAIALPTGEILFQRKAAKAATEEAFLEPWPDPARTVFAVDGVRVALTICSEFGAPRVMATIAAAQPDLLLHPSAGHMQPEEVWRPETATSAPVLQFEPQCRQIVERTAADVKARGMPRLAANPIGFDGATWWPGNSFAFAADGTLAIWLPGENRSERMQASFGVTTMPIPERTPAP